MIEINLFQYNAPVIEICLSSKEETIKWMVDLMNENVFWILEAINEDKF